LKFLSILFGLRIGERVVADIRQAVFAHFVNCLSPSFFEDIHPSENSISDLPQIQSFYKVSSASSLSIALPQ